jgi:PKD repeat protein
MSFEQNPLHTYASKGVYEVCLHVIDFNYQCIDQICRNVEITYDPACEADFTFEPMANDPFTHQFTDNSSGNIVDWLWNFGDGSTSTLQNPEHTFVSEGTFEVCLTITNLWGNCQDVFCTVVVIDIPELCTANFNFSINPSQPFTVEFTDFSSGIMTQWLWNFGDGNTSDIQNPVHVYADTGVYQVNLSIQNPDSLVYCFHSITKQVLVYVSVPECHANFIAVPDSGVNKPNLFHFYDSSTGEPDAWLWDFGDGSTSALPNPDHKFDDFGNYEVSLSITTQNPWGDDCTDTKILQFSSPEYYHFGGLVYAGDYPINNPVHNGDTAQVFVYRHLVNSVCPIDTNQFTNLGYFYFLYLLPGDYLIKVQLSKGSTNASSYFPSYYGNNLNWQDASMLQLIDSCQYHANINLVGMNETENGIGGITGSVVHHIEKFYSGAPAQNIEILLFDAEANPVKYCYSNENGDFEFSDLSLGTYILQAESTGMFTEAVSITLSESSPTANGLQLDLYNTDITATNLIPYNSTQMSISPNPVKDEFYLNIRLSRDKNIRLTILGVAGNKIWTDLEAIRAGDNIFPVKSGNLSKGIYFLRIISDDGSINETLKFVK